MVTNRAVRPRKRRHVADLLSLSNLAFGIIAIAWALRDHYVVSLLCVSLGALCDGLDGAAARRWGGTRFGVLADDIADGVTYGVAPGVAIASFLGDTEGIALGATYALFTLTRLVHFTLNKPNSDPGYFQGIPSTLGGIAVLCALVSVANSPLLVGVAVGAVCVKLVAFSTRYRHAGRWFAGLEKRHRRLLMGTAVPTTLGVTLMPDVTAGVLLSGILAYALWPNAKAVAESLRQRSLG